MPVLDARGWVGDDGFWDSHHLRAAGAVAFTERLGRVLGSSQGASHMSAKIWSSAAVAGRSAARRGEAGPCQLPPSGAQVLPP